MSALETLLNFSSGQVSSRHCRFCKKVFCCTVCRDRHVLKVHPDLNANCQLCYKKVLPLREFEFEKLPSEDEKLLSHIVNKHLPLHCILCGDLFQTEEHFRQFGACHKEYHRILPYGKLPERTPITFKTKLKRCFQSVSNVSVRTFPTPPVIYRNTSTPVLVDQKNSFEYQTPCAPNFSLKTSMTNSSIAQCDSTISKVHHSQYSGGSSKYFSLSSNIVDNFEDTTPFRTCDDKQFPRSNSGRKLDIEEPNESPNCTKKVISYEDYLTSPVNMDLTDCKDCSPGESPELSVIHEETGAESSVIKKVRFSDHGDLTRPQLGNQAESCARSILNITEDEEFHDAHDASGIKKGTKDVEGIENTKYVKNTQDTKSVSNTRDTKYIREKKNEKVEDIKNVEDGQDKNPSKNSLNNSLQTYRDNMKNAEKENRGAEVLTIANQQGVTRVLTMVLTETSSAFNTDLMPVVELINSGLKKLQEQKTASSSSSTTDFSSDSDNSSNFMSQAVTKIEMSVSSVESSSAQMMAKHREIMSSSFNFPPQQSSQKDNSCGILSTVTQILKCAFKNFSGATYKKLESTEVIPRQEIVDNLTASLGSSTDSASSNCTLEIRPGKRARDIIEAPSCNDPVAPLQNVGSPLAKRQRGWYKIKARPPIRRMRKNNNNNNNNVTSPRGVSSETQVFSQGALTVGDTILPLPARAHELAQTE